MIRDQSCVNTIAIESRTQGDHKEFNILLQNFLFVSRFNRKLVYKENEQLFIENSSRIMWAV